MRHPKNKMNINDNEPKRYKWELQEGWAELGYWRRQLACPRFHLSGLQVNNNNNNMTQEIRNVVLKGSKSLFRSSMGPMLVQCKSKLIIIYKIHSHVRIRNLDAHVENCWVFKCRIFNGFNGVAGSTALYKEPSNIGCFNLQRPRSVAYPEWLPRKITKEQVMDNRRMRRMRTQHHLWMWTEKWIGIV